MSLDAQPFRERARAALGRSRARTNIRSAMLGLQRKRRAAFPDPTELERLREQGEAIREAALANLPALLEQLESRCRANGIQVHWAEDAEAANRLIIDLLTRREADALLKGKSMVSEEIGLNAALSGAGIAPVETDLGELIIQLAGDHPSHIVAPAVHKDRHEVAQLFAEHLGHSPQAQAKDGSVGDEPPGEGPSRPANGDKASDGTPDGGAFRATASPVELAAPAAKALSGRAITPASAGGGIASSHGDEAGRLAEIERLTAQARQVMRQRFKQVRAGLSGVNFAVAETGTLCLVENEGNGRMSTTAPDVHLAIMGIEKVIARLDQLPPLLTLLTRSATGQGITTYVNMINGPRRAGERDGPSEVHLVLLDNGRSAIYRDPELRATLRCIRCGACMNHCPVYTRMGGHGYGTVYPGPIGAILEPQLQGLRAQGELAEASTLCGACAEVCPVRIPIPALLNRLRHERVSGDALPKGHQALLQRWLWRAWAFIYRSPARHRLLQRVMGRGMRHLVPLVGLGPWTASRAAPALAAQSLHDLARKAGYMDGGAHSRPGRDGTRPGVAGSEYGAEAERNEQQQR